MVRMGLSGVIERMPSHFLIKYLRKYGATIGEGCLIEKGLNLHRPEQEALQKSGRWQ